SLRRDRSRFAETRDRGSKMRLRRIPEFGDEGMAFERLLDDAALNAAAAPVNKADLAETLLPRGVHVLFDDGLDVARREGMEVEAGFNRNAHVNSQVPTPNSQEGLTSMRLEVGSRA